MASTDGRYEHCISELTWLGHDARCITATALVYADSDLILNRSDPQSWRPCPRCGRVPTEPRGPDPCLGNLPGVEAACCGHGRHDERCRPYVILRAFPNHTFTEWRARVLFRLLRIVKGMI